jgi:hypothetical protein
LKKLSGWLRRGEVSVSQPDEAMEMVHIGYVKRIGLWSQDRTDNGFDTVFEVELAELAETDTLKKNTILKFEGVRSLKLGDFQMPSFAQIEIHNVSADQLEEIEFRVVEEENELFSFVCRSVHTRS